MRPHEYEQCVKEMWRLDKDRHKFGFTIPGRDWMSFVNVEEITDLKEGAFWSSEFRMSVTEAAIQEASFIAEMKYREHKHKHETDLLNQVFLGDTGIVNMQDVRKHEVIWSTLDFDWFVNNLCVRFSEMNEASEIKEAMIVVHPHVFMSLVMSASGRFIPASTVESYIVKYIHDVLRIQNMDRHKNINAPGPHIDFRVSPFCKDGGIFKCIIYDKSAVKISLSEVRCNVSYCGDTKYPSFTLYQKTKPLQLTMTGRIKQYEGTA